MTDPQPMKLPLLKLEELSEDQQALIHKAAQIAVIAASTHRQLTPEWTGVLGDLGDKHVFGLFVTLHRGKHLRGCCGFLGRPTPLREAIVQSAFKTAREDYRLPAISPAELPYLSLDISLLNSPVPLSKNPEERAGSIEVGKHGLRISRDKQAGLLLPHVSATQNWDAKDFLRAASRKAGLHEASWQDAHTLVEVFEEVQIKGKIEQSNLPSVPFVALPPGPISKLVQLKKVVADNLIAITQGATPSVVSLDALDGNVHGVVLSLHNADEKKILANWIHTSLRPGMPLQSSLYELTESAAQTLKHARFEKDVHIEPEVTVLYDPVHHGVLEPADWDGEQLASALQSCELDGIQPDNRAVLAVTGDRCSVAFDANASVLELVQRAAAPLRIRNNPIGIFSLQCMSSTSSLLASNAPVSIDKTDPRRPAFADSFYPASKATRDEVFSQIKSAEPNKRDNVLAIVAPHAAIPFSGAVAMKTWESVRLPKTIVAIGPKHTQHGADWAVSPSSQWLMPDGEAFSTNTDLARKIASRIDGMQMDSNAHLQEHGIEVQLPFIEALCSELDRPSLVSIAMRGATWSEIQRVAKSLAEILREEEEMPLLVISSDMSHYLPEPETRRRDELALAALEAGDPLKLLETCRANQISMCGVMPAAVIMQTLIELGQPFRVERVAYQTSADKTKDQRSCVGYAGVILLADRSTSTDA